VHVLPDVTAKKDAFTPLDDAAHAPDGGSTRDAAHEAASPHDAGRDVGGHDVGFDTGIDPKLATPSADAAPCSPVGNIVVCPLGACLIVSPSGDAGRCQTCSRTGDDCGGHANDFCEVPEDCDIGWVCYAHLCHLFCMLSTPQTCGASTCTNVGNATTGVCL
jgi:hypothetical protein